MKAIIVFFGFFICVTNLAAADLTQQSQNVITEEYIDQVVNNALEAFNVPGIAVGLVINQEIVLTKGYGTRKANEDLPVTEKTVFPLASVTKAFTALLLGQLVDEGRLSFDDPVIKHVPELKLYDEETTVNITVRDLLAHRTGISRHDPAWFNLKIERPDVLPLLQYLEPACGLRENFYYNNFMYTLAGTVYERITGQSWEDALTTRIFRPLAMNQTTSSLKELVESSEATFPHAEIAGKTFTIPYRNLAAVGPGGGINSSVANMTQWLKLQLAPTDYSHIISEETLGEMHAEQFPFTPSYATPLLQTGYGLGWFLGTFREHSIVSHGGNIDGIATDVALLPSKGVGLVILTNSGTGGNSSIAYIRGQIFDKIIEREDFAWMPELQSTYSKTRSDLQAALDRFEESILTAGTVSSIDEYTGLYEHPAYGIYEIKLINDSLVALHGNTTMPLHFKDQDIFTGKLDVLLSFGIYPVLDITFIRNSQGEISAVEVPFEKFRSLNPVTFTRVNGTL